MTNSMNVQVKGKQIDVGDSLRGHVQKSINDMVGKYFASPLEATVVFSREAHLFRADISVHAARGIVLQSNFAANDPYPAFDEAASRIAKRLVRYKKRLIDLHHQPTGPDKHAYLESMPANQYVLDPAKEHDDETSHTPLIVAETTTAIDTLTVSQAVMRIDLGQLPALLFRNRATGQINMVYHRPDGHIGWVDPSNLPEKQ